MSRSDWRRAVEALESRRLFSVDALPLGVVIAADRFEPNDAFVEAENFGTVSNRTENDLTIHASNNQDFFRFTAADSGLYTIDVLFNHAAGDLDATLYGATQFDIINQSQSEDDNEQLTGVLTAGETYTVQVFGFGGAVSPDYDLIITGPGGGGDVTPPTVTDVFVAGSAWNTNYRNSLVTSATGEAAFGYRVPANDQTRTMAWSNLNQISVRFSEDVVVASNDLTVNGVNVASYGINAFAYDPVTFTATWTLAQSIPNDKVTITVDADAGTGVEDTAGNQLDGEWTNPVSPSFSGDTFPSGDGTAGGDFAFNIRVLPGDIDRNGAVNIFDFNVLKPNLNQSNRGVAGGDINGDAVVNIFDFNDFKTYLGKTAPA